MSATAVEPAWAAEPDWGDDPFAGLDTPVEILRAVDADAAGLADRPYGWWPDADLDAELGDLELIARQVAAAQSRVIAEVTARARPEGLVVARSGVGFSAHEQCVVQTSLALGVSAMWAGKRVDEALVWAERVPTAVGALEAGLISVTSVRAIVEETADLDTPDVQAVTRQVLDRLGVPLGQRGPSEWMSLDPDIRALVVAAATPGVVRRWTRRAAHQLRDARAVAAGLDPAGETARVEEQRREQARQARTVEVSPGKEGMAWLAVYAPEAEVLAAAKALETDARQTLADMHGDAEDPMRAQQVVADLAIDRLLGRAPRHSMCPTGRGGTTAGSAAAPGDGTAPVGTAAAGTAPGGTARVGSGPRPIQLTVIIDGEAVAHAGRLGPIERASLLDLVAMARGTPGGGGSVKVTERLECRGHPPGSPQGPYEVPDPLARAIRARDVTCRFPGCVVPATGCDLDHTTPYEDGGPTCVCNLAALCRHHHRLKTHASGWTLRQLGHGDLEWSDPTGRSFRTRPG